MTRYFIWPLPLVALPSNSLKEESASTLPKTSNTSGDLSRVLKSAHLSLVRSPTSEVTEKLESNLETDQKNRKG